MTFLTIYIFGRWDCAIDFTPFSHFNGINLLFVVWITLGLLPLFDKFEFPGFKMHKSDDDKFQKEADKAKALNLSMTTPAESDIFNIKQEFDEIKEAREKNDEI